MPITVFYDSTRSDDGSPPWASHRDFRKLADNLTYTATEVEDDADATAWETPCAQNIVNGLVLIDGPYDAYDVIVGVMGTTNETGTLTGTGRVTGGLAWTITDAQQAPIAKGTLSAQAPPAATRVTPFGASFGMRIPNGVKTRVCGCTTAGGIQISPNPGSFYASMKSDVIMAWYIQFLMAWIKVPTGTGAQIPVPFPVVPGGVTLGGDMNWDLYFYLLQRNFGAFFGALTLQQATEDFQDPDLKRQIGLAAGVMENPEVRNRQATTEAALGRPMRQR